MRRLLSPSPFRYFRISGADRLDWLQGQVTQDVRNVRTGGYAQCAVLTPTGQVLADGALHAFDDHVLLGLDRFASSAAVDELSRRIVMEDVSITEREENCYTLIGDVDGGLPALHVPEPCADFFGEDPEAPKITENEYQAQRILAGVPIAGNDYDLKTLAMELGQNFIDTRIAFEKGCYTGQEIVERIRSRGRTHKSLIGLKSKDDFKVPDQIRVTSAAYAKSHGHVALAFAPIEYSEVGNLVGNATVTSLPFPRGDQ